MGCICDRKQHNPNSEFHHENKHELLINLAKKGLEVVGTIRRRQKYQ